MKPNLHLPFTNLKGILRLLFFTIILSVFSSYQLKAKSLNLEVECLWNLTELKFHSTNFSMCDAEAGTITANEGFICVPGTFTIIEATPDGNAVIPPGFSITYLLTTGANNLIVQTNGSPSFFVDMSGAYTIHPFVFDAATFNLNSIILNTTTLQEVVDQLDQGGGPICGSVDTQGATTITEKAIGFFVDGAPETCDEMNGQVELAPPSNSFVWFDGFMGNFRDDLADGTYIVTVSASSGCTGEIEVVVEEECGCTDPIIQSTNITNANCNGLNGSINIQMVGNNLDYSYQWSPNVSASNIGQNLNAGFYSITISEINNPNCSIVESVTIVSDPPIVIDATVVNETCNQLGSINVTANGGNGMISFDWADIPGGNNPPNRTNLTAGTYTVTGADTKGCTETVNIVVGDDCTILSCTAVAGTTSPDADPVCLDAATVTISATPSGAIVPGGFLQAYVLTSGGVILDAQIAPNFIVNSLGTYTIHSLVYDPLTLDLSTIIFGTTTAGEVNSLLIQGGGTICAVLDLTGATINVIDCGGNPCVTPEVLNVVKTASNCGTSTGTATINMVGNNSDYSFTFSAGSVVDNMVSDLAAGSYSVTIADLADPTCFSVENFSITNADGPTATIVATAPTSCAANNGTATLSPATLDYVWCDGGTGEFRNDLESGICAVTVTDLNTGCFSVLEVEIEELNLLTVTPLINDNPDCGMSNGVVVLSVGGGSNDYTFEWSDPNSIDNSIRNDLPGGTFGVTVTDNGPNGCVGTATFTLIEDVPGNAAIVISNITSVSCPGDANGSVTYSVNTDASFVQPPNDVIIDANGNVQTSGNLPAGEYCVQVTDGNGCVAGSECFTIEEPTELVVNASVTPTTCSQGGSIDISVSGGTGMYTYDWTDLAGGNDPQDRFDLQSGNYGLTVTDANGCQAFLDNIFVADGCTNCSATAGALQADSTNICFDGNALAISATQTTAPNVPAGYTTIYVLTEGAGLTILQANAIPEFAVNALGDYTIHTLVFDPTTLNPNDYTNGLDLNADLLQGGGTICAALDVSGAAISLINCGPCVTPEILNIVSVDATCGNSDGSVVVETVGNINYNFQWSSGTSTTNSNLGLASGNYSFTITDPMNPNCFLVDSLLIANSDGAEWNIFSQTPASCNANNGTAVLVPQTNLFDWSDGISGAIRTNLAAGTNIVTVTDPMTGCTNVFEVFIESEELLDIQLDIVQQPDCGSANGEVNVTITGGSTDYTYIWSDDPTNDSPSRTNLTSGVYSLVVIDNGPNACVDSITFTLLDANVIGATVNVNQLNNEVLVSCTGDSDGMVDYSVILDPGFVGTPIELIIDGNGMTQTNGQLAPGSYCIVVIDGNGCIAAEECFVVINPDPIDLNISVTPADCNSLGMISTIATGGTPFLIFDWDDLPNSSDPQNRFNLEPGLYSLTVTDANGCTAVANDILVQDDCNSDCPTSSEGSIVLPINTVDSFCVSLDSCFVDSLTTYELLGGGLTGSSIYGSWELTDSCLIYTANDTAGVFVDTICVLANYNVLTDTTCIIVTVLPECGGADIIPFDSLSITTDNCVDGAEFCLEIELAQILNFTLTDNGDPYDGGLAGCNFDTTYFYSLSQFLNVAPVGPYSLTSLEIDTNIFVIDSFQTVMQLVDSMNVWDPTGNWMLDGSTIVGGMPGMNYGSLNIIQLITGASTNLEVDLNQIPNGTQLTLDTGFHELIITDLVTGCPDTLYVDVICDDCPADVYSGPDTIVGDDCNGVTDLCLNIPFQDFLFNYDVIDNGTPYTGIKKGCGFDTLSTCYLVSALPDQGAAGPYEIEFWEVGGITFASTFSDLQELLDLMNGWDPTGNWVLDVALGTICGGTPGQTYGTMEVTQSNTGAIATLEPDFVIQTFASAIELDTGFHQIILVDTIAGCTDTIDIQVDCNVVTGGVDTVLIVEVMDTDTFCFNLTDTIVSAINLCPDLSDGNVSGFGFIPNTNCIEYTGDVIGFDTFCMVFEYIDGTIDTAGIVIQVVPKTVSGDTIPVSVFINCTETICINTSSFMAPLDTIYNECDSLSGTYTDIEIIEPNCIEITGINLGGQDTACIVICDTLGVCDTTVFLIDVINPVPEIVFDTILLNTVSQWCYDSTELCGNLVSIENICDSLSLENFEYFIDANAYCVNYEALELGTDTACIVICDDLGTCDTTTLITTAILPLDTLIAVDDDTITITINPVTIDILGNDTFNPDSLSFGIIQAVSNGTLITNPDGSVTYLAQAGFCGALDSFTYFISNGMDFDTATVTIEVLCDDLFVYNGFSPNNDGVNETLVIQGIDNFPNNLVTVYNRWGNLVYQQAGYTNANGWNGTFEGKDLPSGTYFYIINDGEGTSYDGWIQIWR